MTVYYLSPIASIFQFFTDVGLVLNGGKVSTYLAGTSTPTATYTDSTGATPNANPIILNSAGRLPNVQIWQPGGTKIKVIVTDANNNQIGPTFDQVAGIDDPTDLLSTLATSSVGSGADLIANAVRSFDLFSSVRAAGAPTLIAGQTRVIDLQAGVSPDDGLGGLFYWSATSTATDDGANVLKPTSVSGAGRYLRQANVSYGTFTGTLTGMTGLVTLNLQYKLIGNVVSLSTVGSSHSNNNTGTSNSTAMTLTGLPSAISPAGSLITTVPSFELIDNSVTGLSGIAIITISSNSISFGLTYNGTAFTNSGTKGLGKNWTLTYSI